MKDANRAPTVWPTFRARDAHAMIKFLTEVVGFTKGTMIADDAVVHHAALLWGDSGGVMLGSETAGTTQVTGPGDFSCYLVTDEPDELCRRIRNAGGQIMIEPFTTDYGSRDFSMRDPEGNNWYFGSYRGVDSA